MCLLSRKHKNQEMPSFSKTASLGYDGFSASKDYEVVSEAYSADKEKRFKILRRHNGIYTYVFEAFYYYDEDELKYTIGEGIGYWCPIGTSASFFESAEDAISGAKADLNYKTYFI